MSQKPPINALVIALGSTRRVGKDTLATLLRQLDPRFSPYSFAQPLKNDIDPFIVAHFGFSLFDCTEDQKELVRPLLISYGMAKRALDQDYWVKRTLNQIVKDLTEKEALGDHIIPIVTDCRFVNEAKLFRNTFSDYKLINLSRKGAPPPTDEEEKHWRGVSALADYHLKWGGEANDEERLDRAREVLSWLKV